MLKLCNVREYSYIVIYYHHLYGLYKTLYLATLTTIAVLSNFLTQSLFNLPIIYATSSLKCYKFIITYITYISQINVKKILKFFLKRLADCHICKPSFTLNYLLLSKNLCKIVAISALVALSAGFRVVSVLPLINPVPTAY